jgi:hypothetical protein
MALRIRAWNKWQGAQCAAVKRNRKKKNHNLCAPYSMQAVSICTQIERDGNFRLFAREVGPRNALTFFLRVIIAAGQADGMKGAIEVSRSEIGRWVLSTPDDRVGKRLGENVYDALILSHLCTEFSTGFSPASGPGSGPGQEGGHCIDMDSKVKDRDPGSGESDDPPGPRSEGEGRAALKAELAKLARKMSE